MYLAPLSDSNLGNFNPYKKVMGNLSQKKRIFSETGQTSNLTTEAAFIRERYRHLTFTAKAVANVAGTLDIAIEHSPDGESWFSLASFDQITDTESKAMHINSESLHTFSHFRAVVGIGGGGDYDLEVDAWHGQN